jgi:hypothetical protein
MSKWFNRVSLISALALGLSVPSAFAVDLLSHQLSVSITMPEVILIDFPDGGATDIELEISGDCSTESGICMLGVATIDFELVGNSRVLVRARPEQGSRVRINERRLGVFTYATDPGADVPPLYYDVRFEIIDAALGEDGFGMNEVENPDLIMLDEITQTKQRWRRSTNLRNGNKIGRIYIQPLFDGGSSFEELNIAVPGIYTASLELLVTTR